MRNFQANIYVKLKSGILDPQGKTIEHALHSLGFDGVSGVTTGKLITLRITAKDRATAEATVRRACDKLLANPVIEDYSLDLAENGAQNR